MTSLRALVCSYYLPEPDRDSGSRRVLDHVDFLREAGWTVEFAALNGFREKRYVRALARRGVATHATANGLEALLTDVRFDLVVFCFWQTAERYLPLIRRVSPATRVIVDSVDLQFLRDARRTFREPEQGLLSEEYGSTLVGELNVYGAADAVLTVSAKEADTIRDFTGDQARAIPVPDAEDLQPSALAFTERQGIVFVGSFQHAPNASAVEFLCRSVVPLLDESLLEEHPITIVGAGLDDTVRGYAGGNPHVRMVGWVPSVTPYLEQARISVVPLLYGAGTKRKLIQALLVGTPTVSTTIGVEGLDLADRQHVLIADDAASFAECIAELIADRTLWRRLERKARAMVQPIHGRQAGRERFLEAIADALARPATPVRIAGSDDDLYSSRMIYLEHQKIVAPIREILRANVAPGATIAVLSNGSPELLRLGDWQTCHFPLDADGSHAGPVHSSEEALRQLEGARSAGVDYLVVPGTVPRWQSTNELSSFVRELETQYACVSRTDACAVYALRDHGVSLGPTWAQARAEPPPLAAPAPVRLISLYLPQFHPIAENDEWWGEGFTEWHNVARAKPLFPDHYQPHIPADVGFYDLRLAETRVAQAVLAREYGIHGFCYYHYWFEGKRLLERPFDEVLASGEPDFPFCLCWANEPWTRRWDGRADDLLQPQRYSRKDDLAHIKWLLPALADPRAIRIGDKPLFVVYQARDLPEPARTVETWRREAEREGLGELYLMTMETGWDEGWDATEVGFDAKVMFRPQFTYLRKAPRLVLPGPETLEVHDYGRAWPALAAPEPFSYPHYEMVCPSWDNTPRAGERAIVLHNSTPEAYGRWLAEALERTARRPEDERIVFINAWNEWAEGCHLEPDQRHGAAYLEATREALLACATSTSRRQGRSSRRAKATAVFADRGSELR